MNTDSYVVRIYRRIFNSEPLRGAEERETLVGVVEDAAGTKRHKFQSIEELWVILSGRPTASKTEKTSRDDSTET